MVVQSIHVVLWHCFTAINVGDLPSGYLTQPWYRWSIEIDGLPNLNMGGFSMAMLNNQMVNQQT